MIIRGEKMYPYQQAEAISSASQETFEELFFPVVLSLERKNQFLHFLQKELDGAKTETEREAISSILLKTKIQIRALERELQKLYYSNTTVRPFPNIFFPALRARRLQ